MASKQFSTGFPKLDHFVGQFQQGDSLMMFLSNAMQNSSIVESIAAYSKLNQISLVYLSAADAYSNIIGGHPKFRHQTYFQSKLKPASILSSAKKYISKNASHSYIVLDDLSEWKKLLSTEQRVVELFRHLSDLTKKTKSLLILSATRSGFRDETLAQLKDQSTICLDLFTHQNRLFCHPLALKGRYVLHDIAPFRIDNLQRAALKKAEKPAPADLTDKQSARLDSLLSSFDKKYENAFKEAGEAMVLFDIEGDYREINRRAAALLGYTVDELKKIKLFDIIDPSKRYSFSRFLIELRKRKKGSIDVTGRKKNGKPVVVRFHSSQISDGLYFGMVRDLTEQNQILSTLQDHEEEYRSIVHNSSSAILIQHDNKFLFANKTFFEMFGYGEKEDFGSMGIKLLLAPESVRKYRQIIKEREFAKAQQVFEAQCMRKDNTLIECRIAVSNILYSGKYCSQLSLLDISAEKNIIQRLREAEQQYRNLVENAREPVSVLHGGLCLYVNKSFLDLFGFDSAKVIAGQDVSIIADEAFKDRLREFVQKFALGKIKQSSYEFISTRADGKQINCEMVLVPVNENKTGEILAFFSDTTELVSLRLDVKQRLEEVNLLKTVIPSLLGTLDLHRLSQGIVQKVMENLSWEMGSIYYAEERSAGLKLAYQKNFPAEFIEKISVLDMNEGIGGFLSKTQLPHKFTTDRYPSHLPHRSLFKNAKVKTLCLVPLVARDKMVGMMILCAKEKFARYSEELFAAIGNMAGNMLANSHVHQKVQSSERQLNELIESNADILYIATPTGSFNLVNLPIERLTGYTRTEFYKTKDLWLKLIHPDDKKIFFDRITRLDEISKDHSSEYRILPKGKAAYRWVRDTVNILRDDGGEITGILGSITDISEQKRLIDALTLENALNKNILADIAEGVVVFDRSLRCLKSNTAMENICGKKEIDITGKPASIVLPFFEEQKIENILVRTFDGETIISEDIPYKSAGEGQAGFIRGTFSPLRNKMGSIEGVIGLISDISRRKKVEDEIRESQYVLSNVIDTMGDILILTNLEGKVVQVNRTFLNTLGYNRSETNGCEFPYPWLLEEEMGRFVLWIASLREHTWLHDFDMTLKSKSGQLIPVSLSTTLLRNQLGEPIAMLNIARNITERKRLMRDLENRNKQIEMINRIITKANETLEFTEIFSTVTREIKETITCDDINIALLNDDNRTVRIYAPTGFRSLVEERVIPIDRTLTQDAIREGKAVIVSDFQSDDKFKELLAYKEGLRSQISIPVSLKNKTFGTLNLGSNEPYTFSEEYIAMLQPIVQQVGAIIERVLLFNQVSEDSAYIHNLLDSIDSVVYTVDTQLRIREVNKAWHEFMRDFGGAEVREYQGKNLFDLLPSGPLKVTFQNVVGQMLDGSVRIFSQEFIHRIVEGERIFQLTINPMIIERKIVGLVFTHTEITALKKTEADLKKSNEQLLALHEISMIVSGTLDLQKMLNVAIPLLRNIIDASAVIFYLIEPEGNDLTLAYQIGFDRQEYATIFRLRQYSPESAETVPAKKPMYISKKAYLDERIIPEKREILRRLQLEGMAFVPLISKDKVFGALEIFYNREHDFSDQDEQILMLVSNQLGAAIENARLYNELKSQVDQLTVLYQLSQQLTSTLNIEQIFEFVFKQIKQVIPFQMFKIDLYDDKTKTRTPVMHVEKISGEEIFLSTDDQSSLLIPGSTQELVVTTKRTYQSPDRRAIILPMLSKEMILGVMSVEADTDTKYSDAHLKILESIGYLMAIALEKGKLYEETLQKSVEILRRNKELDDFTYVVSHDLKEPLISVEGFSRILQADYQEIIQGEGKEYLDSIVGATTRMKGLIDDLLLLSRVSRPSESFKNVSVQAILDELKTDMEFTIRQKGISFVIPQELPIVYGNETQLKIIFRNLIGNAIKFNNKPNPVVEIKFRNAENNYYLFSVKDNGIGIDKEFHEKIFVIFQRLHRREEYEGTGAGLAIVKKIIELHKGKIWIDSELGRGSTFFFTIPKQVI